MAPPIKKKIHNFKYQKAHDFKTTQMHGVYGGMNIRGQLNMNFYVETVDLSKTSISPIINNKLEGEEFPPVTEQTSIRELHFGINLDLSVAKSTANWMLKRIEEYEKKFKALNTQQAQPQNNNEDANNTSRK